MSDLDRMRDELRKKRQAASNKIARVKRNTGANVAGTQFDPRRQPGIEKRYNARQLQAHINELNQFLSRGTQFVGLRGGKPAPKGEWNVYKRREAWQEEARAAHDAVMGGLPTPTGMTVRQNQAMVPESVGSANYGPYRKYDRQPGDVESLSALRKLSDAMAGKTRVNYLPTKIKQGKENLEKALTILSGGR